MTNDDVKAYSACPSCNGEAQAGGDRHAWHPEWKMCRVWCRACGLMTANCATPEEAREAWNRRAPDGRLARYERALLEIAELGCDCDEDIPHDDEECAEAIARRAREGKE